MYGLVSESSPLMYVCSYVQYLVVVAVVMNSTATPLRASSDAPTSPRLIARKQPNLFTFGPTMFS